MNDRVGLEKTRIVGILDTQVGRKAQQDTGDGGEEEDIREYDHATRRACPFRLP